MVTVDEIRRVSRFLSMTSHDGSYRVVIVDPADDMNTNAANALLKNLEEPPSRTVFILIAHSPGASAADDPLALPGGAAVAARRRRPDRSARRLRASAAAGRRRAPGAAGTGRRQRARSHPAQRSMAGSRSPRRSTVWRRRGHLDVAAAHRLADAVSGRDKSMQFDIFNRHALDLLADAAERRRAEGRCRRASRYSESWQRVANCDRRNRDLQSRPQAARAEHDRPPARHVSNVTSRRRVGMALAARCAISPQPIVLHRRTAISCHAKNST